jgi:hypothetical protein
MMAAAEMADYRLSNEAMARRIQRSVPLQKWPLVRYSGRNPAAVCRNRRIA